MPRMSYCFPTECLGCRIVLKLNGSAVDCLLGKRSIRLSSHRMTLQAYWHRFFSLWMSAVGCQWLPHDQQQLTLLQTKNMTFTNAFQTMNVYFPWNLVFEWGSLVLTRILASPAKNGYIIVNPTIFSEIFVTWS